MACPRGIPQVLRYEAGQFYKVHADTIRDPQVWSRCLSRGERQFEHVEGRKEDKAEGREEEVRRAGGK
eukprot:360137-Chlamydomonas_euryale.AAC.10